MTHIEQMIKDLCPNGVEWKKLGELGVFESTGVDKKCRDDEQEVTLLNFMDVCRHKYIDASVPTMVVTAPDRKITQCNVLKDDIFITPSSETIDEIGFAAVIMEDLPNVVYSYHIMRYRLNHPDTTTAKFIRYLFEAPIIRKQILKGAKGLTRFGLSKYQFADLEIPLPPLEIQKKIVECLDKFSALAAELQAELQKRRTQYEYYRTRLLTPPQTISPEGSTDGCNWEWKTLGEVCDSIKDGMHNLPVSSLEETDYPIISAQNIYDNKIDYTAKRYVDKETFERENKRTKVEVGDILLTIVATIGRSAVVKENRPVLLQRSVCVLKPHENIVPEFLKYSLDTNRVQSYMIANAHGAAQAGLYLNQVEQIKIPVPPFAEQQRIADLLDRFDKLITSMEEGIPAEQAAQQKRYEYYRDLLLTFDRKAV